MSDNNLGAESIGDLIHKEKVPKRKLKAIGQWPMAIGVGNRTIGSSVTQAVKQTSPLLDDVELSAQGNGQMEQAKGESLSATQRHNAEIDSYLDQLLSNGYIDFNYRSWFAKSIQTLGIHDVNVILLNVQATTNVRQPQRLFAYKVKGALTSYYKRVYEAEL